MENFVVRRLCAAFLSFSFCFAVMAGLLTAQQPTAVVPQIIETPQEPAVVVPKITGTVQEPAAVVPKINGAAQEPAVIVETGKEEKELAAKVQKKLRSEYVLPASTKFWVSVPDAKELQARFDMTQFGVLAKDPAFKPFADGLQSQAKRWMNEQNVRLGMELDDLKGVQSGEICLAGILPLVAGAPVKGSHGIVLLVDVSNTTKEAKALQAKINKGLIANGAKQEKKVINGVEVTVSTLKRKRLRNSQSNFQAIVSPSEGTSWMLVSDNELVFRDILKRLAAPAAIVRAGTLVSQEGFVEVMRRTSLEKKKSQLRWCIDPFGYIQLAQALENEKRGTRPRDDWATILKDHGMGAAKAIGGNVAVATGEHEILHRTFAYAPRNKKVKNAKRMFDLFDFSPVEGKTLAPPAWISKDCSAYVSGNWEMTKALGSFGHLYDAFIGEEGSFKRLLNDFKIDPDMQLDIEKLVGLIDNRFTIVSETIDPINEASECIVIGFPVKGEPEFIFESIKRASGGEELKLGGFKVIKVVSQSEAQAEEEDPVFELPDEEAEEEEEPAGFTLFEERYFAVNKGHLLVANNKNYLKKILAKKDSKLAQAADYIEIKTALEKISDPSKVSWRQFGRTDKALEANYELLRRGEMGKSKTILGKIVNQIFKKQAEEEAAESGEKPDDDVVRKQKLDGSKLPADFDKSIAPYFGPMGWVLETESDGWGISGVLLKKKTVTELIKKIQPQPSSQR